MVKTLRNVMALTALAFATTTIHAQDKPQIPNSDFEQWTGVNDKNHEPDNWNSFETAGGTLAENSFFSSFVIQQQIERSEETRPGSTGKYSAVIWARNAIIATAQANLTLGRIIAGSAEAANKDNHNQTITSDDNFSQKLGALPKAIVAWVKFVPKAIVEDAPYARISATVHDSYDYIEYGTAEAAAEDTENASHIVAHAEQNFLPATDEKGKYQWQRLEIPFSTEGYTATDPAYIIVNLTTNSMPGKGSDGDSLYIDDIELIYDDEPAPEPSYADMLSDSYTGTLTVTIDGNGTPASKEVINITKKADGTIDLGLDNFKLFNGVNAQGDVNYMFIGNILVTDIKPASEDGKLISLNKEQVINITEGTDPEGAQWLGPMLSMAGGIPVSINGTAEDEDLELDIDITMATGGAEQQIHVHFTTKEAEPNYADMLSDSYTGTLTVTINGEATPSTQECINIDKKEDGTIDLSLNNFKLISDISDGGEISYLYVGNILVTDIKPTSEDGEQINIQKEQTIQISSGTDPADAMWMGPTISENGGIPVNINGTAVGTDLELGIDITMSLAPGMDMLIHVDFTTKSVIDAIATVNPSNSNKYAVYTLNGVRIATGSGKANLSNLPKGIYIVESNGIRTKTLNK